MRDRMVGQDGEEEEMNENTQRRSRSAPPRRATGNADDELKRAIEESKRSLAAEQAKQGHMTAEERDLAEAIKLSEEEEKKRNRQLDDSNQSALFDDQNQLINLNSNTNNPYSLVDAGLQSQFTQQVQPQMTAMPAQFTSFNPYQQQAQQEAMQAEYARQQQEWLRQQQEAQMQQQAQMQAQQQQDDWMRQQQLLQLQQQQQQMQIPQQPLLAQPTGFGSNNPFAPLSISPSSISSYSSPSPAPQASAPVFNLQGTYSNGNGPSSFSPPPAPKSAPPGSGSQRLPTKTDQQHQQLAGLIANRDEDGIDSFGNFGQLRFGQQAGRLVGQATGPASHNPFSQQQQHQQQQGNNEQPFFSI